MTCYEVKKVFSKRSSRISLLVLAALLAVVMYFMISDTIWVNEKGDGEKGFGAIQKLREAKRDWAGMLTEEEICRVIQENNRINNTPEAQSEEIWQQDIAYGWKQGFYDIRNLLVYSYGGFQDYDYYLADTLTPEQAGEFYQNRIKNLEEWLAKEEGGANIFSEKEKAFLMEQYQKLETPLFYDYQDGWKNLFQWAPAMAMITTMVLGFLCAGIFADEFRLKASAVLFSSYHGRKRAVRAKLKAGLLIVTGVYWGIILLYSLIVLGIFGADGAGCPIQSTIAGWKSFYNITNGQAYLLIVMGGYLGCLFMVSLVMLVSAAARSSVLAVTVPFILIFLPSFLSNTDLPLLNRILGLLPDQLLQMNQVVKYFNLYGIGGKVVGAVPVLLAVYLVLTLIVIPVTYRIYRRKQIS